MRQRRARSTQCRRRKFSVLCATDPTAAVAARSIAVATEHRPVSELVIYTATEIAGRRRVRSFLEKRCAGTTVHLHHRKSDRLHRGSPLGGRSRSPSGSAAGASRSRPHRSCRKGSMSTSRRGRDVRSRSAPSSSAMQVKVRRQGAVRSTTVLLAVGVTSGGRRESLGLEVALGETGPAWERHLRQFKDRSLKGVEVATSDAHEGLRQAMAGRSLVRSGKGARPTSDATWPIMPQPS